jgi:hypothetical protein
MSTSISMEEVHAKCISTMGEELGTVFATLHRNLIELHIVWQQYRQLFGSSEETIELLNRTSGLFFKIVQDEIWDSVLLTISRLTDPPETGRRKNLTINSLPGFIADPDLKEEIEYLCECSVERAAFAREHRNKRIAHQDYDYTSNREANPLSGISRERVEHMLDSLRLILNRLNLHFWDSTTFYETFIYADGARALVSKLRKFEHLAHSSNIDAIDLATQAPRHLPCKDWSP